MIWPSWLRERSRRAMRPVFALVLFIAAIVGLVAVFMLPAIPRDPPQRRPASADTLYVAQYGAYDPLIHSCSVYPVSALTDDPPDTLDDGPELDALNAIVRSGRFVGASWRLVQRGPGTATFVGVGDGKWICLRFGEATPRWRLLEARTETTLSVGELAQGIPTADWGLDERYPAPGPGTTRLQIMVLDRSCASTSYANGRILPALVKADPLSIAITIGVRPLAGTHNCMPNPPTPAVLDLGHALGARVLRNGAYLPPKPPEIRP